MDSSTVNLEPNLEETLKDANALNLSGLPQINEVVNEKYQIVREIARGGMGVVYEAQNIIFNTRVALKMLQLQESSPTAMKRFEREFQVCSQLSHPNIIKMYDCGVYKKIPYIVMDYIEGIPITEYVRQHDPAYGTENKRDYNLCVKLIAQIANALEYIHQHKIYHRDIKPSNILVCKDGTPILIDFGIVKFQQNHGQSLTKSTEIIGTCNYMSPEQIQGKQVRLDNRSDVYSLGIVLYELLTEQRTFNGSIMEIMYQINKIYPPLPSTIRKDIPKALENIIMTAIEKDREYRYQSAKEFANDLELFLENKSSKHKDKSNNKRALYCEAQNSNKKRLIIGFCFILLNIIISYIIFSVFSASNSSMEKSFDNFLNLAKHGNAKDQFIVGSIYYYGIKVDKNIEEAISWYKKAASKDNADAQYKLGDIYYNDENIKEAISWYEKAANLGHADAQDKLGGIYHQGDKVDKDIQKAFFWFEKSANQNNANAQYNLGAMYYNGETVKKDIRKALFWFEKSANLGHADAQNTLGEIYSHGIEVLQDFKKAFYWYEKSANQNNANAQYNLGVIYYYGKEVKKDIPKALYWFEKSANQNNAEAQCNLGVMYYYGEGVKKNIDNAISLFQKAATQNYSEAQKNLGAIYYNGEGVEEDLPKAIMFLKQAAMQGNIEAKDMLNRIEQEENQERVKNVQRRFLELQKAVNQNDADAQYKLAEMYYEGDEVSEDLQKAFYLYEKAANLGHIDAQYKLAELYYNGDGVPEDSEKAFQWYEKAANQNHVEAQYMLGEMYYDGEGVEEDLQKAIYWYKKAAMQNHAEALEKLEELKNSQNK